MISMIDLHAHILSGLDDGPRTLEESLRMCEIAYRDGIRTVVATPHTLNGVYENDRQTILAKVQELNSALIEFEPLSHQHRDHSRGSEIDRAEPAIRILPGADVHFSDQTFHQLGHGKVMTMGDSGKGLLIEFPVQGMPHGAEDVLFRMITRGFIPIISHPERNVEVRRGLRRYQGMIRMGCLGQITAMSLTGGFGPAVKRVTEELLLKRLAHLIASDAHSTDGRPPILSSGVQAAARIVGREEAHRMVSEYPRAILEGQRPDLPEPMRPGWD